MLNNDFFINLKPSQIPPWDKKKNFWEQKSETLHFWLNEWDKINNGITINGVFIHPWLYFHCNHFKTPIPLPDGTEPNISPFLRDNEWYIADCIKSIMHPTIPGYYTDALLLYGSRRYSKTTFEASFLIWTAITRENSKSEIICGSSKDLTNIAGFLKVANTELTPAFKMPTIKKDWDEQIIYGYKEGNRQEENIYHSISVKNADSKSKDSAEKTAGGAPVCAIYDEIGKFAFKSSWLALRPALKTPHGIKGLVLMSGTSGTEDLSRDAYEVLANPKTFGIAVMDWDNLERYIDPEFVTWKRRTFACFMPPQMAYEDGLIKVDKTLAEYLKVEDPALSKIVIQTTDWGNSNKVLKELRVLAEKDPESLKKEKLYHPLDPEECFESGVQNPFPATVCRLRQQEILETGSGGKKVKLYKVDNEYRYELSEADVAKFPFEGGTINSPILLYDELPKGDIPNFQYVGAMDPYKQASSDTSESLGTVYILKRKTFLEPIHKIVLSYSARPTTHNAFNVIAEMALEAFNAECMMENADGSFLQYLEGKNKADKLLVRALDWSRRINPNTKVTKEFGWHPSPKNKSYVLGKAIEYANEEVEIGIDENGNKITKLGAEFIDDYYLLEEMISYRPGGNYDRLVSFGAALAWIEYLDSIHLNPKTSTIKSKDIDKERAALRAKAISPLHQRRKN